MLRCRIGRGRGLVLLSCKYIVSRVGRMSLGCMRARTQGCEDGGNVWLSHIGANQSRVAIQ